MRAYFVVTGRRVSPFGDPPGRSQYAEGTIDDAWAKTLARASAERLDVDADAPVPPELARDGGLVVADHCFASEKCVKDFLAACVGVGRPARLALARTPSVDYTRPVSSIVVEPFDAAGPGAAPARAWKAEAAAKDRAAYDLFLVPPASLAAPPATMRALLDALRRDAARVVVPKREVGVPIRLPLLGDAARAQMTLPLTSTLAAHVEHWVHVLWLNHLAPTARFMEIARDRRLWALSRAIAAGWPTLPRLMKSFVAKGRGVQIHETAHVEASILGDGVVIGARASVKNSILGAGVEIGDHASVLASTIGARAYVTPRTFLVWSTIYEDAVINNLKLQVSVVGRRSATNLWAGLIDAKFQGAIDVVLDGEKRSTERSFLGSALGHDAYVGAKVLILPGREVPSGAYVTMRPDEIVVDVPRDMPPGVPHVRDRGTLVPLDRLLPARHSGDTVR